MKSLLENRFAPITFTVGFWECPLQTVADAGLEWLGYLGVQPRGDYLTGTLPETLRRLEPLHVLTNRFLLLSTDSVAPHLTVKNLEEGENGPRKIRS